jgi:hypothetical protein
MENKKVQKASTYLPVFLEPCGQVSTHPVVTSNPVTHQEAQRGTT